ncbi:MAG TPA: MotA/TolQ/ExbB proton channel family protein [Gemmataceae bacterium]|nr:MotA/TolQ/ExbB proton channel family protein [Gemmataceae bacterium]
MGHFAAHRRPHIAAFVAGCLLAAFLFAFLPPALPTAHAQDDAPAAGEGDKAPESSAAKPKKSDNILMHIIKSLSWFAPVMLIVSIALMSLMVLLFMELRMGSAIPPGFVEDFTETVNKRRFKEAYEMAKEDGSFLGRVMTTGMSRLQYGIDDSREAAFNMVESIKASKDQLITYLATIGTLGPMLGLVGTVWGMIMSFMELGRGGAPNPADLANGISHALSVTLVGIALSVPAIFFHAFFRNRLIRISMDVGNIADDLLTQMYHNSKKPAAPEPAAAPAPAADTRGVATAAIKPK